MILQRNLRQAFHLVTGWDKGGLLLPIDTDTNDGTLVMDVLISKHTEPTPPKMEAFNIYDSTPPLVYLYTTPNIVKQVDKKIQGAEGSRGIQTVDWKDCKI